MAPRFPFPYDLKVYVIADDNYEVAYYSLSYLKYKRVRHIGYQTWEETTEQEIDTDHFWMVVACIERAKVVRHGLV